MIRVVVDTNITVSAFIWGGVPGQLFNRGIEQGVIILSSNDLLHELTNTFNKTKLQKYLVLAGKTPDELVAEFTQLVTLVEPAPVPLDAVRDPDDVKILAAAVGSKATHIIFGDQDLLVLEQYADIPILTAQAFLQFLNSSTE